MDNKKFVSGLIWASILGFVVFLGIKNFIGAKSTNQQTNPTYTEQILSPPEIITPITFKEVEVKPIIKNGGNGVEIDFGDKK